MAVKPAARKTTNAQVGPAGRRVAKKGEPQYASYAEKTITPVMEDYAAWLTEQTGYKVDPLSVQLGSALRGAFQKSEGNQQRIERRAQEREDEAAAKVRRAEEREQARAEKEQAKAERAAEREQAAKEKAAAAKAAPKTAAKAPAKAPAKTAAKTAAAKPAAKTGAKVTPLASRRRPASTTSKQTDF